MGDAAWGDRAEGQLGELSRVSEESFAWGGGRRPPRSLRVTQKGHGWQARDHSWSSGMIVLPLFEK